MIQGELKLTRDSMYKLRYKVYKRIYFRRSTNHMFAIHRSKKLEACDDVRVDNVQRKLKQVTLGYDFCTIEDPIVHSDELKDPLHRQYCNVLPWIFVAWISKDILQLLQGYHREFMRLMTLEIDESKDPPHKGNNHTHTAHKGNNHTHTGQNIGTSKEFCGDYHSSKTLLQLPKQYTDYQRKKAGKKRKTYRAKLAILNRCEQLRRNFQETIASAIRSILGDQSAYNQLREDITDRYENMFGRNIASALIDDTPFTTIWFSSKSNEESEESNKEGNVTGMHQDENALGLCILFCLEDYAGGDVNIVDPDTGETIKIHMKPGMFLVGRWSRSNHWNDPVINNSERYSYVVYFNNKIFHNNCVYRPLSEMVWYQKVELLKQKLKMLWNKERADKRKADKQKCNV
jgi:hypothetical protein